MSAPKTEADATWCGACVWITRFTAPCPFGNVAGLNVHVAFVGKPEQENVSGWLNPSVLVTFT
jgi:hypothetical protein